MTPSGDQASGIYFYWREPREIIRDLMGWGKENFRRFAVQFKDESLNQFSHLFKKDFHDKKKFDPNLKPDKEKKLHYRK